MGELIRRQKYLAGAEPDKPSAAFFAVGKEVLVQT
jgi:hypothetical protein